MNYIKATNFYLKDSLVTGDPAKIIRGTEVDAEFNAIATAIISKADLVSPALSGTPTAPTPSLGDDSNRIATTAFVLANAIPAGLITLWSGSTASIPSDWLLCDGTLGTPDLRNRFIIGAGGTHAVGVIGGSADAVVVSHTHSINDPGHTHTVNGSDGVNHADDRNGSEQLPYEAATVTASSTTGISIQSTGVTGVNANLPPYYALAYIMKT